MKKKIIISSLIVMFICITPGLSAKASGWTATGDNITQIDGNTWELQAQSNVYENQQTEQKANEQAQKIAKKYEEQGKNEKTLIKPNPYNLIDSFEEGLSTIDSSNRIYSRTRQVKAADLITQDSFKSWAEAQSGSNQAIAYNPGRYLQCIETNQTLYQNGEKITNATIYHYIRYPQIIYNETATQNDNVVLATNLKYYVWRYYCEKDASQNSTVNSLDEYRKFTPLVDGKWTVTATPFYYQTRANYQSWTANATTQYIKTGSGQASAAPQTIYTASGKRNYETFNVDIGENESEKRTWTFEFIPKEVGLEIEPTPDIPDIISITDGYTYETGLTQ